MDATQWATFWVFAALVVFIGVLIYLKVPGMAVAALDKRAEKIKTDLDQARRLFDQRVLRQPQQHQHDEADRQREGQEVHEKAVDGGRLVAFDGGQQHGVAAEIEHRQHEHDPLGAERE